MCVKLVIYKNYGTKYLLQISPTLPQLKAQLKIHKEDLPMRPVVNHINSPAYKIAKFLRKNLMHFVRFLIHIVRQRILIFLEYAINQLVS